MKKFEIVVCAYGTLERIAHHFIEARDVDHARSIGIICWCSSYLIKKIYYGQQCTRLYVAQ